MKSPITDLPIGTFVKLQQRRGTVKEIEEVFLGTARVKFDNNLGKCLHISAVTRHWQYGETRWLTEEQLVIREISVEVVDQPKYKYEISDNIPELWLVGLSWKELLDIKRNTGRNDECPCGSGKKYKKCHEEKIAQEWKSRRLD